MIKTIHHICIETNDYSKSMEFYTKLLGFIIIEESANFHGRLFNTWLEAGSARIELQTPKLEESVKENQKPSTGLMHVCFEVDDLLESVNRLEKNGAIFKKKDNKNIYEVFGQNLAKIIAPEGTVIELRE